MVLWLVPILALGYYIGYKNDFPGIGSPLHASCQTTWEWKQTDCRSIHQAFLKQIELWAPFDNCKNGGQKCLYALLEEKDMFIKATHTTPIKRYVDTMDFTFKDQDKGCIISAFSSSDLWYAILDFGTNYCNLWNLLEGTGLDQNPDFTETTSPKICTQYASRNCTIY